MKPTVLLAVMVTLAGFVLPSASQTGPPVESEIEPDSTFTSFLREAEQGDPQAQFLVGSMYLIGRDVPQDTAEGIQFLTDAAEQGHGRAQLFLAAAYWQGIGVLPDSVRARMWCSLTDSPEPELFRQICEALSRMNDGHLAARSDELIAARRLKRAPKVISPHRHPGVRSFVVRSHTVDREGSQQLLHHEAKETRQYTKHPSALTWEIEEHYNELNERTHNKHRWVNYRSYSDAPGGLWLESLITLDHLAMKNPFDSYRIEPHFDALDLVATEQAADGQVLHLRAAPETALAIVRPTDQTVHEAEFELWLREEDHLILKIRAVSRGPGVSGDPQRRSTVIHEVGRVNDDFRIEAPGGALQLTGASHYSVENNTTRFDLSLPADETVARLREDLATQGFGVIEEAARDGVSVQRYARNGVTLEVTVRPAAAGSTSVEELIMQRIEQVTSTSVNQPVEGLTRTIDERLAEVKQRRTPINRITTLESDPASITGHASSVSIIAGRNYDADFLELVRAIAQDDGPAVRRLLKKDASLIREVYEPAWTPLLLASAYGRDKLVRVLIDAGASVEETDLDGWSALTIASRQGDLNLVRVLLKLRADVHARDQDGYRTALHHATDQGHYEVVDFLLRHDAAVDAHDGNGYTPLMRAARGGRLEAVTLLVEAGADVDASDDEGRTPLHLAALNGHEAVVDLLLSSEADAAMRDAHGQTAMELAATAGHDGLADRLRQLIERAE